MILRIFSYNNMSITNTTKTSIFNKIDVLIVDVSTMHEGKCKFANCDRVQSIGRMHPSDLMKLDEAFFHTAECCQRAQ